MNSYIKSRKPITIITPTYNRKDTLCVLYESLLCQKNKEFLWLIVDDGSVDNTKDVVFEWIKEGKIDITYVCQENKGKHIALNTGISMIESEMTFIVDSDDVLTDDAVSTILNEWHWVEENNLCGISYLRGYDKEKQIGDCFSKDYYIDTFINVRINNGVKGDKAEVWKTELLKQVQFPYFEGEKFFGEIYVWSKLSETYKILHRNKIIYITEYLQGGLTKSGRALRIKCPKGGQLNAQVGLSKSYNLRMRIKNAILYDCYSFFDKQNVVKAAKNSGNFAITALVMPIGYLLYKYWNAKYGD